MPEVHTLALSHFNFISSQMVKNCRNIRGIEGISLLLILMWTLGDSSNLVGAILTKQLPLQVRQASR